MDPKWKQYVQMWENGRIERGKDRYSCGRMGGFKVERVGTNEGEWGDPKWKGYIEMW